MAGGVLTWLTSSSRGRHARRVGPARPPSPYAASRASLRMRCHAAPRARRRVVIRRAPSIGVPDRDSASTRRHEAGHDRYAFGRRRVHRPKPLLRRLNEQRSKTDAEERDSGTHRNRPHAILSGAIEPEDALVREEHRHPHRARNGAEDRLRRSEQVAGAPRRGGGVSPAAAPPTTIATRPSSDCWAS